MSDKVSDVMCIKLYFEYGDIVVFGLDGLWDNLSEVEVLESVEAFVVEGAFIDERFMDVVVRNLFLKVYEVSMDKLWMILYFFVVMEYFDMVYSGGKKDDISVVVCYVRIGNGVDR